MLPGRDLDEVWSQCWMHAQLVAVRGAQNDMHNDLQNNEPFCPISHLVCNAVIDDLGELGHG